MTSKWPALIALERRRFHGRRHFRVVHGKLGKNLSFKPKKTGNNLVIWQNPCTPEPFEKKLLEIDWNHLKSFTITRAKNEEAIRIRSKFNYDYTFRINWNRLKPTSWLEKPVSILVWNTAARWPSTGVCHVNSKPTASAGRRLCVHDDVARNNPARADSDSTMALEQFKQLLSVTATISTIIQFMTGLLVESAFVWRVTARLHRLLFSFSLFRIVCWSISKKGASGDISGFPFLAGVLGYAVDVGRALLGSLTISH